MALFVNQNDNRSELQQRIASELQAKAKVKANGASPDGVEDSRYVENTKKTTGRAWIWIALVAAVIIVAIVAIINSAV